MNSLISLGTKGWRLLAFGIETADDWLALDCMLAFTLSFFLLSLKNINLKMRSQTHVLVNSWSGSCLPIKFSKVADNWQTSEQ